MGSDDAGQQAQQQAMTAERLAELREMLRSAKPWIGAGLLAEAVAEVERRRAALDAAEAREAALAAHVNEALTDIAQSVLESGGLPPEQFPLDHARVTIVSIERRLQQARALLASAGEPSAEQAAQDETFVVCPDCGSRWRQDQLGPTQGILRGAACGDFCEPVQ